MSYLQLQFSPWIILKHHTKVTLILNHMQHILQMTINKSKFNVFTRKMCIPRRTLFTTKWSINQGWCTLIVRHVFRWCASCCSNANDNGLKWGCINAHSRTPCKQLLLSPLFSDVKHVFATNSWEAKSYPECF